MSRPLLLLLIEDVLDEADLVMKELTRFGYAPERVRIETGEELKAFLLERSWDLIISDFFLPNFDGLTALKLRNELAPDIPFILVYGALGEDTAVELMKSGAQDDVFKESFQSLGAAVDKALMTPLWS